MAKNKNKISVNPVQVISSQPSAEEVAQKEEIKKNTKLFNKIRAI